MAQLGRLDVYFSTRDKDVWDVISTADQGDRGYWLKYYARLGILAAQNGGKPLTVPPISLQDEPVTPKVRKKITHKQNAEVVKEEITAEITEQSPNPNQQQIIQEEEISSDIKPTSSSFDSLKLEIKKIDPIEKRKQAMANFIIPDSRLLDELKND